MEKDNDAAFMFMKKSEITDKDVTLAMKEIRLVVVLYSDNGWELVNRAMDKLVAQWPDYQMRQGRLRNPQC